MISHNPYDRIAQQFSQTRQHGWKDFEFFRPYLQEDISVLDVGCGNGRLIDFLKPYFRDYIGIDTSEGLLKEAESRVKGQGSGKCHFEKASMVDFVRPDAFDAIFSIASFHHLQTTDHRLQTLKNFHRSLKPNGYAFILVWNLWQPKYIWKYLFAFFFGWIFGHGFKMLHIPWKDQKGEVLADRYYYAFSKRELEKLLKKSGFQIVETSYIKGGNKVSRRKEAYNILMVAKKL